jgi:hypothetical protein
VTSDELKYGRRWLSIFARRFLRAAPCSLFLLVARRFRLFILLVTSCSSLFER